MKLSLYKSLLYLVENDYINPRALKFDYNKRVIYYSGEIIVKGGICLSEDLLGIPVRGGLSLDVDLGLGFIDTLENLYRDYYLSERKYSKVANFISKEAKDSSDILLLMDEKGAEYKRVKLESFLYCVIAGSLYDWEFGNHWYWVSSRYRRLYLYRKWF